MVDGDTLLLTNGEYVRLIGVDTPETKHPQKPVEHFGKEAYQFTNGMVEGKEVKLRYDQTRKDRYNRILAYVYLIDRTFLNAEIIKQGYGFAYTKYPFRYMEEFRRYEGGGGEGESNRVMGVARGDGYGYKLNPINLRWPRGEKCWKRTVSTWLPSGFFLFTICFF